MKDEGTTSTNFGNIVMVAFGTAALFPLTYEVENTRITTPRTKIEYQNLSQRDNNIWKTEISDALTQSERTKNVQKIKVLNSFSKSIIEHSKSLDKETIEIVNKYFWEWI